MTVTNLITPAAKIEMERICERLQALKDSQLDTDNDLNAAVCTLYETAAQIRWAESTQFAQLSSPAGSDFDALKKKLYDLVDDLDQAGNLQERKSHISAAFTGTSRLDTLASTLKSDLSNSAYFGKSWSLQDRVFFEYSKAGEAELNNQLGQLGDALDTLSQVIDVVNNIEKGMSVNPISSQQLALVNADGTLASNYYYLDTAAIGNVMFDGPHDLQQQVGDLFSMLGKALPTSGLPVSPDGYLTSDYYYRNTDSVALLKLADPDNSAQTVSAATYIYKILQKFKTLQATITPNTALHSFVDSVVQTLQSAGVQTWANVAPPEVGTLDTSGVWSSSGSDLDQSYATLWNRYYVGTSPLSATWSSLLESAQNERYQIAAPTYIYHAMVQLQALQSAFDPASTVYKSISTVLSDLTLAGAPQWSNVPKPVPGVRDSSGFWSNIGPDDKPIQTTDRSYKAFWENQNARQNLSNLLTNLSSQNDVQKQNLRQAMFIYQEFVKSASLVMDRVYDAVKEIASRIAR